MRRLAPQATLLVTHLLICVFPDAETRVKQHNGLSNDTTHRDVGTSRLCDESARSRKSNADLCCFSGFGSMTEEAVSYIYGPVYKQD